MAANPFHVTPYVSYVSTSIVFDSRGRRIAADSSAHIRFANAEGVDAEGVHVDHGGDTCSVIAVTFPAGSLPRVTYHEGDAVAHRILGDQPRWVAMARDAIAQHLGPVS